MNTMSNIEEIHINTPYGQIYGRSAGDPGDLLVLGLHGWSQRNGWQTWQPLLRPLGNAGFYAISVDLPGWGNSKSWKNGSDINAVAKSAVLSILDTLDYSSAVLMGKSWGGGIALHVALDEPQKVSKLILTAPAFSNLGRLNSLSQPVLLAWSEDDPVIPFKFAGVFKKSIADIQTVYYKTGGHSAALKNSEDFIPRAIMFLQGSNS